MVMTTSQAARTERLGAKSERLARHAANCEALAAAYARRRNRSLRLLRGDIDSLLQNEMMATDLWEDGFDPDRFLDALPASGKRRYCLI
jgi:hypothetical protein